MKCRICQSEKVTEILDLGKQPLANKYPKNKNEIAKEKKYSLNIIFCSNCKSAQIKKIINRKLLFEDYYYLSSVNNKLKKTADALLTANIQTLKTYADQQKILGRVQNVVDSISDSTTGMIDNILGGLGRIPVIGGFLSDLFKPFGDTASNIIQGTSKRFMNALMKTENAVLRQSYD